MIKLHKDRLLKLASYLKTTPEEFFDLDVICDIKDHKNRYSNEDNEVDIVGFKKRQKGCGTVACAVGHCPVVFPNQFKYVVNDNYYEVNLKRNSYNDVWTDIEHFFGIASSESDYLFQPEYYPENKKTAFDVATRIEYFVRSGEITGDRHQLV